MRKAKLLELNEQLFKDLEKYKALSQALSEENAELKEKLEGFSKTDVENTSPEVSAEVPPAEPMLADATAHGAKTIGKIVISAAKFCNLLTSTEPDETTKEMINLILGRTEVAKAEILKHTYSSLSVADKIKAIDGEKNSAEDYFIRIMAQKE